MAEAQPEQVNLPKNIELFMEISGLDYTAAEQVLSINNYDLEKAINFHLESHPDTDQATAGTSSGFQSTSSSTLPNMPTLNDEEKELRAPIPPKRETIILPEEDNFRFRKRRNVTHNVCPLRNFQRESELQEAQLSAGFVGRSIDNPLFNGGTAPVAHAAKRSRLLEDLFRPPVDLICPGTLLAARDYAKLQNRWLIVNLQDNTDFSSQVLNRDIWSDSNVRSLIQRNFVFWQVNRDNSEGNRFHVFYGVRTLPAVVIIDPRTGEEKLSFKDGFPFTAAEFARELRNFLRINYEHPNVDECAATTSAAAASSMASASAVSSEMCSVDISDLAISDNVLGKGAKKVTPNSVDLGASSSSGAIRRRIVIEASEEEQMLLAIENSLRESQDAAASAADGEDVITIDSETEGDDVEEVVSYEFYMGSSNDPITKLILRLPDGNRDVIEWPCTTQLAALKLYVVGKYPQWTKDLYKIICSFPRKNVLDLPGSTTLKDANLHPNATLHFHLDE